MNDAEITSLKIFIQKIEQLSTDSLELEDKKIYGLYLSKASNILEKLKQNQPVDDDISLMDKLFGTTWLKNDQDYSVAYENWDKFKELFIRSIHGMTVNERLFNLGLLDEFDAAVSRRDKSRIREILLKCSLSKVNINNIIQSVI